MTPRLSAPVTTAVLLIALEPSSTRGRIEAALALLGHPVEALEDAIRRGLVRSCADRIEVVDVQVSRCVTQVATDRERRLAHLALACSRARRTIGYDAPSVFAALSTTLEGTVPLPTAVPDGPASSGGPDPLTRREQEVAELAASGLPTREIAAASYLSQKTVEYHLTRVYRKLGVRSKSELAFALGGGR
jgi:DNA-binding NarL/FixJ family response regulator